MLAIRELIDAYAHCADHRDADGQKALFTKDTHFVVYMNGPGNRAHAGAQRREALTPVFDGLNRYQATTHFNGQSTITLDGWPTLASGFWPRQATEAALGGVV